MVLHSHISQKSLSGGHGKAQQQQQQELVTTELVDEKVFDIEKRLVFLEIDCFFICWECPKEALINKICGKSFVLPEPSPLHQDWYFQIHKSV